MEIILIAIFGAAGCVARFGLSGLTYRFAGAGFPYGTLAVNVLGSFFLGAFLESGGRIFLLPPTLRTAIALGFFGGFTTFSTFSFETVKMIEEGSFMMAGINVASSLFVCLIGAYGGIFISRYVG
jgi:CrcB protein